ncbi:MAG: glycosyltransferase [Chitinispirillia bacterium]|jgi:hypothetical protein
MNEIATIRKVAFVGNYIPRHCGIATFTTDLCRSVSSEYPNTQCIVIAVNDGQKEYKYPQEVRFEIEEKDLSSYQRAAEFLNISNVDMVCLQHEFGIFGGEAGSHVLAMMRDIKAPLVTTLHTVLSQPSKDQRAVMKEIVRYSCRLVVMTERAGVFMQEIYKTPAEKIDIIPHGIPDMPFVDSTGVFQHAVYTVPNFAEGYCTDDNARCLILTVLLEELGIKHESIKPVASTCAAFLNHALDRNTGRFRNFLGFNRKWIERQVSDDSHGRALWALGTCIGRSHNRGLRNLAGQLWEIALPSADDINSPRACAFSLIGIHEYLRHLSGDSYANHLRSKLTKNLVKLYHECASEDWPWFEDVVSYGNSKLPHALILSGRWTDNPEVLQIGLKVLFWLCSIQTSKDGYFQPIGSNGFYNRNNIQASFDQQPVEAFSMIAACKEAYHVTGDEMWLKNARLAFDWFLGRNDLGVPLYDPESGGCRDALLVDRVNENQGAESTLAFLLSLAEMQLIQNKILAFKEPSVVLEK